MNIAVAQFQPKDGDKAYNLSVIRELTKQAAARGADVISFHEMSVTAYTFAKNLSHREIAAIAEQVPGGPSTRELMNISKEFDVAVLAGLIEKSDDKIYNHSVIRELTKQAAARGADVISFHEMSVTAYTFAKNLSHREIAAIAEQVPGGPSTRELMNISKEFDVAVLAGLIEKSDDKIYNTYLCVSGDELLAKYRKLHPFISKYMSPGNEYCVFDLNGWKCGILICYDNNVIENVRATSLLCAELLIAPHV